MSMAWETCFALGKKKSQSSPVVQRIEERARHFLKMLSRNEITVSM